jgi:hypothetical protein
VHPHVSEVGGPVGGVEGGKDRTVTWLTAAFGECKRATFCSCSTYFLYAPSVGGPEGDAEGARDGTAVAAAFGGYKRATACTSSTCLVYASSVGDVVGCFVVGAKVACLVGDVVW